jgi:hypothetical protein
MPFIRQEAEMGGIDKFRRVPWHRGVPGTLCALALCGAAQAASAGDETVRFTTWREPNEGAYTIDVPQGWSVSGGVMHRTPVDLRSGLNVASPDGAIRMFIGDFDLLPRREPDQLTSMAGMREGGVYSDILMARFMNGAQFAERYPAWKLCRQPQIMQSGLLRPESEALTRQIAPYAYSMGTAAMASIGEAAFRCGEAEGFVSATTLLTRPASGQGVSMWFVYQLSGFMARDARQAPFAKQVLSTMLASLRMNRDWEARNAQAAGQHAQAMMRMNDAFTQATLQRARQQSAQGLAGGWNHPNTANLPKINRDPNVARNQDIANRGTRRVCDNLGTCTTVDNAWESVWRDHSGNVVRGSGTGAPPDNSGVWTQMK